MTDQQGSTARLPDPVELSHTMARIAEQSQRLVVATSARPSSR